MSDNRYHPASNLNSYRLMGLEQRKINGWCLANGYGCVMISIRPVDVVADSRIDAYSHMWKTNMHAHVDKHNAHYKRIRKAGSMCMPPIYHDVK